MTILKSIFLFILFQSLTLLPNFAQHVIDSKPSSISDEVFPDTLNKPLLKKIKLGVGITYTAAMSVLAYSWYNYKEAKIATFHVFNDNGEYLQMDKFSHAFATYHIGSKTFIGLRRAGVPENKAILYSSLSGFLLWTPIELVDGFFDVYGFSPGDVVANASGSALFGLQQAIFKEQIIKMKFSFFPTDFKKYSDKAQRKGRLSFAGHIFDYNAQTYWFSGNLHKVFYQAPPWLCVSVGVGAKGMVDMFKNPLVNPQGLPLPQFERYKQILFSLDIDLTKVKTRNHTLKKVFNTLNMLKIPAPTLEWNRIDGIKFHPIYF